MPCGNRIPTSIFTNEAYKNWAEEKTHLATHPSVRPEPYKLTWGGGCKSTPISPEELHAHLLEQGWPKASEVDDVADDQVNVPADTTIDFDAPEVLSFNLWGVGRWARNVDRQPIAPEQVWYTIEKGIHNYFVHVGKSVADSGNLMLMVEGSSKTSATYEVCRSVVLITGTIYIPHIFDVTQNTFVDLAHAKADPLPLPCDVTVLERLCRVTNRFQCIDDQSSDEWIADLIKDFSSMSLFRMSYFVPGVNDGVHL